MVDDMCSFPYVEILDNPKSQELSWKMGQKSCKSRGCGGSKRCIVFWTWLKHDSYELTAAMDAYVRAVQEEINQHSSLEQGGIHERSHGLTMLQLMALCHT